jgi:RimJ/RimL family protein N-acetyltransferase
MLPVELRDVRREDVDVFYEHQRDEESNAMAAFAAREHDAHLAHWTKILADDTVFTKTILFGGEVAGNVTSWRQGPLRLVGYWIGKPYWGRGIATGALTSFLEVVQERPLHAYVAAHNLGSIRVLEKCGFCPTGEPYAAADGVVELLMQLKGPDEKGAGQDAPRPRNV